jgi:hypothetical protein
VSPSYCTFLPTSSDAVAWKWVKFVIDRYARTSVTRPRVFRCLDPTSRQLAQNFKHTAESLTSSHSSVAAMASKNRTFSCLATTYWTEECLAWAGTEAKNRSTGSRPVPEEAVIPLYD